MLVFYESRETPTLQWMTDRHPRVIYQPFGSKEKYAVVIFRHIDESPQTNRICCCFSCVQPLSLFWSVASSRSRSSSLKQRKRFTACVTAHFHCWIKECRDFESLLLSVCKTIGADPYPTFWCCWSISANAQTHLFSNGNKHAFELTYSATCLLLYASVFEISVLAIPPSSFST